MATFYTHV